MHTRTFAALLLAASTTVVVHHLAHAASVTDSSYYNLGGPGVTNSTVPAAPNAFGGRGEPAITASRAPAPASTAVDGSEFNTAPVGQVASMNPTGVPGSGYGETVRDPRPNTDLAATEPVDASSFNTSGPGALTGINPHLKSVGAPATRFAASSSGTVAR